MTETVLLDVDGLSKTYGSGDNAVHAVGDLTFKARPGEFICIVGPSGCGKTTLLKMLSGLMPPSGGTATLGGRVIDGVPPELALVFQEYTRSLLPWLKIEDNVALPLRNLKDLSKADRKARVAEALEQVGLTRYAHHYPWQLSGGMQQRVAIARGIAYRPEILLMDEPFASVDAQTRADLEDLVLRIRDDLGVTVVLVTHDIDEAVYLADRVVVLGPPPTSVLEVIDVDLPYPRDQIETRELPEFAYLRADVTRLIKRKVAATDEEGDDVAS